MGYEYWITPEHYSIAEENGISANTLEKRVRDRAWPIKEAVTIPPIMRNKYTEWVVLAKQNGIGKRTFETRIYRHGWTPEKAATTPVLDPRNNMKVVGEANRKHQKKYEELALRNGICRRTFLSRVLRKWSLEDAATRPIETNRWHSDKKKEMAKK